MAAVYKVTKIALGTRPSSSSGLVSVEVSFMDTSEVPPPHYTQAGELTVNEAKISADLQSGIDTILFDAGFPDTISWAA